MHALGRAVAATVLAVTSLVDAPPSAQADFLSQARRLDLEGQHEAAIALYGQALERTPDSFEAHYGIARALDLIDRYDVARQHFARAIELAPEGMKDQALRMMGVSYTFTGSVKEAATYFKRVFDRRVATNNLAGAAEVANELGRVYLELGDLDNARKWYRTGYDTEARQVNRPAREVDLTELRWAHAQARIAARRGDRREALRVIGVVKSLIDRGTNRDQAIQYPYLVGYVHFHLKEYRSAIVELQKADQDDPFILVLLAEAHEGARHPVDAGVYYRKALRSTSHAVNNAFARRIARQKLRSSR
jgi:tetratricopeptide (TPR) repeat protein